VHFTGWLPDAAGTIAGSDLFVSPSLHEGMSNALLEAWGAGVPVLAARTPEAAEVLADDELVFDPHDAEGLARRLAELAASPQARRRLEQRSRERAASFDFDWGARVAALLGISSDASS
jgi:glycosyltransferase involved in cell wall biosynthesis